MVRTWFEDRVFVKWEKGARAGPKRGSARDSLARGLDARSLTAPPPDQERNKRPGRERSRLRRLVRWR